MCYIHMTEVVGLELGSRGLRAGTIRAAFPLCPNFLTNMKFCRHDFLLSKHPSIRGCFGKAIRHMEPTEIERPVLFMPCGVRYGDGCALRFHHPGSEEVLRKDSSISWVDSINISFASGGWNGGSHRRCRPDGCLARVE